MRRREGSRGPFWGCTRYRDGCRGTRPLDPQLAIPTRETSLGQPASSSRAVESPNPTGDLVADLRSAGGHIGRAIDLLRRHQDKINEVIKAEDVSF